MTAPHSAQTASWIRGFHAQADPDAVNLLCLPHAGGSASFYYPLARALAPGIRVLAVQYPGRQDRYREPSIPSVPELAVRITAELPAVVTGPLAIFGHSMGAVIGYEIAARLRRDGKPEPLTLFASGRRAPSRYREERVHQYSDDGIRAVLRSLGGAGTGLPDDEELAALLLPAIRSDYQAIEVYRHQPGDHLTCPIVVLTGDADPVTSADEAADWRAHTTAGVSIRTFSGGHFFLADHAAAVTDVIRSALDRVRPARTVPSAG